MTWGFLWLMLALKIPIAALLYIVWWAIHQTDAEPESGGGADEDGGTKVRPHDDRRPLPPRLPRRRGPHGDPSPPAPARTRTTVARSRDAESA